MHDNTTRYFTRGSRRSYRLATIFAKRYRGMYRQFEEWYQTKKTCQFWDGKACNYWRGTDALFIHRGLENQTIFFQIPRGKRWLSFHRMISSFKHAVAKTLPQHDFMMTPETKDLHTDRQLRSKLLNLIITFLWRPNILGKIGDNVTKTLDHLISSRHPRKPDVLVIGNFWIIKLNLRY